MKQIYEDGTYLTQNPSWGKEDANWKAQKIKNILSKNNIAPQVVYEVGCGSGEILNKLAQDIPKIKKLVGFDVSSHAIKMCQSLASEKLSFYIAEIEQVKKITAGENADVLLLIDVIEHVEDIFGFMRIAKGLAKYKLFHIPLDMSAQSVLREHRLLHERYKVGHIHYFTKGLALSLLKDCSYEIVDYCYTPGAIELPNRGWKANLLKAPRKYLFSLFPDFSVRLLGGYSLLVLAK